MHARTTTATATSNRRLQARGERGREGGSVSLVGLIAAAAAAPRCPTQEYGERASERVRLYAPPPPPFAVVSVVFGLCRGGCLPPPPSCLLPPSFRPSFPLPPGWLFPTIVAHTISIASSIGRTRKHSPPPPMPPLESDRGVPRGRHRTHGETRRKGCNSDRGGRIVSCKGTAREETSSAARTYSEDRTNK